MDKIILLDWDGPISNSRTWRMPKQVDPVAIQMLNDLTVAGWKTVLTSTVRKHFFADDSGNIRSDAEALEMATQFMRDAGFMVQWYSPGNWCTDPGYTSKRYLEVANWLMNTEFDDTTIMLVVDDERFPAEFIQRGKMQQIHANCDSGIDYLALNEAYSYAEMPELALCQSFQYSDPDEEDEEDEEDDDDC